MGEALWFDRPEELVEAGVDYFGPVARKRRRRLLGFSKADVAETTNVIWIDLDPPPTVPNEQGPLIAQAELQLEALKAFGLAPSVFIFSGRGCWAYWRLDRHIPQAEAESLMRRLYARFRGGGSEHDIGRIARMPGSINEKTGLQALVIEVDGGTWSPDDLVDQLPEADVLAPSKPREAIPFGPSLSPGGRLPVIELPVHLSEYISSRPSKAERRSEGIDGSALEQAIVSHLVNAGYSDSQIALYFDHHRLPRHEEEKKKRGNYSWLAQGIANARSRLVPSPSPLVSIGNGTYSGENGDSGYGPRQVGWSRRRWLILKEMPVGHPTLALLEWIKGRFEIGRSQARRDLDWLAERGYITQRQDEQDGRLKRVYRTDEGQGWVDSWDKMGTPFVFLKGLPHPHPSDPSPDTDLDDTPVAEPPILRPAPAPRPERWPIDEEKAAIRVELRRRQRSLINDVHRIHIPGNRWTYVQALLPIEDWPLVRLHLQLPVGVDEDGLFVFRSFIIPKDPALGGAEAPDPIEQRVLRDGGFGARDFRILPAAELAETPDGFELASRLEQSERVPSLGLIVQADWNFTRRLRAYRKHIPGSVIAARKRGRGKGTTYEFFRAGDGIEIDWQFDLDAFLTHLADPAEMESVLGTLPNSWRLLRETV